MVHCAQLEGSWFVDLARKVTHENLKKDFMHEKGFTSIRILVITYNLSN